jgi:aminoglycoside phosphotransferase (APT) family kinase protein
MATGSWLSTVSVPSGLVSARAALISRLEVCPHKDTGGLRHNGRVLPDAALRWVTAVVGRGSQVTSARRLRPGSWNINHALGVTDSSGRIHRLVLRRWARPGWAADDPDYTAGREARVLELLRPTRIPAPEVVAADPQAAHCDVPALLLSRLPGHPPRSPQTRADGFCRELAGALAQIHDTGGTAGNRLPAYRLYYDRAHAAPARWMPATGIWADVTAAVREAPPPAAMTLIHRDYHPQNTLWSRLRLTAVVDWTQASWGPPGLDLGHMRWNLAADHGQDTADQFLACYHAATGADLGGQPYWDLVALLDLLLDGDGPGDIEPRDMRQFEDYARTVLSRWT